MGSQADYGVTIFLGANPGVAGARVEAAESEAAGRGVEEEVFGHEVDEKEDEHEEDSLSVPNPETPERRVALDHAGQILQRDAPIILLF